MNLDKEMPYFLKHNEVIIKKKLYLKEKRSDFSFNNYSPAYLITTENINGYYDLMDFQDKSILTVIGSSDQIFEAINRGATNIDAFDISIYAIMFYYLKEAALRVLTYEEYINFFYFKSFNKSTFNKIMPYLNDRAILFWKLICSIHNPKKVILSSYITEMPCFIKKNDLTKDSLKRITSYLNQDNFYTLKNRIKDVNIRIFLNDVKSLDNMDGMYDYLILSNIIDYQYNYYYIFMEAINRYMNKIKPNGEIKVGYLYRKPNEFEEKNFDINEIPNYLEALTNVSYASKHYILTKKKN